MRPGDAPFAVVGDSQDTLTIERYLLMRESNPRETQMVFAAVGGHRPAFVVLVGDLTGDGSSASEWRRFDSLTRGMRDQYIPIFVVMGNHDYGLDIPRAEREFASRFPQFAVDHWYARTYGSLAMLFLDSNAYPMPQEQWARQAEWFARTLAAYDADAAIDGIIVFSHHPPYTNSTVTSDDPNVLKAFVPAFVASPKTVAMISGHTHAYEHFIEQGKHFIVTGGGGGPRVHLREGSKERHTDLYAGASPRPFHYLWIAPRSGGLSVTVEGLDKGAAEFRTIDRFELPYCPRSR